MLRWEPQNAINPKVNRLFGKELIVKSKLGKQGQYGSQEVEGDEPEASKTGKS